MKRSAAYIIAITILIQVLVYVIKIDFPEKISDYKSSYRSGYLIINSGVKQSGLYQFGEGIERSADLKIHLGNRLFLADAIRGDGNNWTAEFIGKGESAAFWPVNWIYAALPIGWALAIELTTHYLIVLCGTFFLARRMGAAPSGAILAAILMTFSGQVWGRLYPGHLSNIATISCLTWVFGLTAGVLHDPPAKKTAIGLAIAVAASIYAGHFQYVYYAAIVAGIFVAAYATSWRQAATVAAAWTAGVILAGPQIYFSWLAFADSARATGVPYFFSAAFFLHYPALMTALNPFANGDYGYNYFGMLNGWEETVFFGGAAATILAGVGAWRDRRLAIVIAACLVLAFGMQTKVYNLLYEYLPLWKSFRGCSKFALFATMFAAVAAGKAFDKISIEK